jgi:hypothetical protein
MTETYFRRETVEAVASEHQLLDARQPLQCLARERREAVGGEDGCARAVRRAA